MQAKARSPTKAKNTAYVQYSKRLAATVSVFWIIFRVACLALLLLHPSLIDGMRNVMQGVDDVMMANIAFYSGNSVAEKGIVGYFSAKKTENSSTDEEEEDDDTSNG